MMMKALSSDGFLAFVYVASEKCTIPSTYSPASSGRSGDGEGKRSNRESPSGSVTIVHYRTRAAERIQ